MFWFGLVCMCGKCLASGCTGRLLGRGCWVGGVPRGGSYGLLTPTQTLARSRTESLQCCLACGWMFGQYVDVVVCGVVCEK